MVKFELTLYVYTLTKMVSVCNYRIDCSQQMTNQSFWFIGKKNRHHFTTKRDALERNVRIIVVDVILLFVCVCRSVLTTEQKTKKSHFKAILQLFIL